MNVTFSETSMTATLISDEELPESRAAEFFLLLVSVVPLSQGQTSSDVEAPATIAMLGFFTLEKKLKIFTTGVRFLSFAGLYL